MLQTPAVVATDADTTQVFFALAGDFQDEFAIDPLTGAIVTQELLDYESTQEYPDLSIIVFDVDSFVNETLFSIGMSSNATLRIMVQDENDNSPIFVNETVQVFVPESTPSESEIYVAMATDGDDASNALILYSINDSSNFRIDSMSGAITPEGRLDYELQQQYTLEVTATDLGFPPLNDTFTLIVNILDQNDNPPIITNPLPSYSVRENLNSGQLVGTVNATDADSDEITTIQFEITAGNEANRFYVDRVTGNIFTNASLDREEQATYSLVITVSSAKIGRRPADRLFSLYM